MAIRYEPFAACSRLGAMVDDSRSSCWHAFCSLPSMSTIESSAAQSASAPELLQRAIQDAMELGRAELTLAKQEVVAQARSLASSAFLLLAGLIMLQAAITTLGVLLVLLLRPPALGFIVVFASAAIALALGVFGLQKAKLNELQVGKRAKRDAREIAEAIK